MPFPVVSPVLFNAQAMFAGDNEPHIQPGIHLRVNPNPGLGLPVAPFVIWRQHFRDASVSARGTDTLFVDIAGGIRTPPFQLEPDTPVFGYPVLSGGQVCIWAEIEVGSSVGPPGSNPITVEAMVPTANGLAAISRRVGRPHAVAAPGIAAVRISGRGTVMGMEWIADRGKGAFDWVPYVVLNLPHEGGPRYLPITTPIARCEAWVLGQAPKRRPLQETVGMVAPAAAPTEPPAYDLLRVNALSLRLAADLDALVTDMSAEPHELAVTEPALDANGAEIGSITQRRLDRVMQMRHDPGTATLLGHKFRDPFLGGIDGGLMFYWVAGFFRSTVPAAGAEGHDPALAPLLAGLGKESRFRSRDALIRNFRRVARDIVGFDLVEERLEELEEREDYVALGALAIADMRAPPAGPEPPDIAAASHAGWLPLVPPEASRKVRLEVAGVAPGNLIAAERHDAGGGAVALNTAVTDQLHLPMALAESTGSGEAGTGSLVDGEVPPDPVDYGMAQQDAFGQWSDWRRVTSPAPPRPAPPRPAPIATYAQPADPASSGGTVRVRVNVPPLASLAPGGHPLAALRVEIADQTTGTTASHVVAIADPLDPRAVAELEASGPVLAVCEVRRLEVVARWEDTAGTLSHPSETAVLTATDLRPPAQLPPPPDFLAYSSRPDATGRSWVEHEWQVETGQAAFAVYYTDENRLRAHLGRDGADAADAALLADLAEAADAAARATIYRGNPGRFPGYLFERLTGAVFEPAPGRAAFRHALSGSLRVLSLYRIAAESAANARPAIDGLPLHIYAVPNLDPPPKPMLEVRPATVSGGPIAARLSVRTRGGVTPAETWRLRRSTLGATDLLRMPVVSTGPLVAGETGAEAEMLDEGPIEIAPGARLHPWVRYHWMAEVRGADAPGSAAAGRPVTGRWSAPSDPVSIVLVPLEPPARAAQLALVGRRVGDQWESVRLRIRPAEPLAGGSAGAYRIRAFRQKPGEAIETLPEAELSGEGPFIVPGGSGPVPAGTLYRCIILDPIGRESPPAETVLGQGG